MIGRRQSLVVGIILIVIGGLILASQIWPAYFDWLNSEQIWQVLMIVAGIGLLILGIAMHVPSLAVPACIVGGIGILLYWQSVTGKGQTWEYAWTLILGFVGIGFIVAGLLNSEGRSAFHNGSWLVVLSLVLFAIFGTIFGGGLLSGVVLSLLLIAAGIIGLLRIALGSTSRG
jgi:hypothetical protein